MNLRFVSELPHEVRGRYGHYSHERIGGPGWDFRDLRAIARRRQDQWLDDIEAWHTEISGIASRALGWWSSPGSRVTAWYPLELKALFFALAALEETEGGAGEPLYLVGCPPEVRIYARELATPSAGGPRLMERSLRPARFAAAFRALIAQARRAGAPRTAHRRTPAKVVVFSYVIDPGVLMREGDHYFGGMLDEIAAPTDGEPAWIYYIEDRGPIRALDTHFSETGRRSHFYFEWLGPAEIFATIRDTFTSMRMLDALGPKMPPLRIGGRRSDSFAVAFHRGPISGRPLVNEFAVYHALRRAFAELSPETIVYPYEEKGLERVLLQARDTSAPAARAIAFAHAVYNNGHLYTRHRRSSVPPRPDVIATTGDASTRWFVHCAGVPRESALTVGSPRYRASQPLQPSPEWRDRLRIVFLVGYAYEPSALASYVEEIPSLFGGCELMVRRYPYAWPKQDRGISRLVSVVPGARVSSAPLDEQIQWADLVLFDSTSAGVHAMLRGRLALSVALPDMVDADPWAGKGELPGLVRCGDASALAYELRRVRSLELREYLAAEAIQHRSASRIYSRPDKHRISSLVVGAMTSAELSRDAHGT